MGINLEHFIFFLFVCFVPLSNDEKKWEIYRFIRINCVNNPEAFFFLNLYKSFCCLSLFQFFEAFKDLVSKLRDLHWWS